MKNKKILASLVFSLVIFLVGRASFGASFAPQAYPKENYNYCGDGEYCDYYDYCNYCDYYGYCSPCDQTNYLEGYFIEYKNGMVGVETYDGLKVRVPFVHNPELLVDGRPVKIKDFHTGMDVYMEIRGGKGYYMETFSAANPGYVKPGSRSRIGIVKAIDRDQIKIGLGTGEEATYFLSPGTIIRRQGVNVPANALYPGDSVKVTFDDGNTSLISRLDIEGESILIKNLYKGKIGTVDPLTNKVDFEDISALVNGNWKEEAGVKKLVFNEEIPIYIGGVEIPKNNLKYYKGKTAYLAIKDDFGREKVEKMVVKNNYENSYSNKIENINWYSSQIELSNKQNISINEGTMVIKNGRLVDINSLNPNTDGLIITDGRGQDQVAGVIYVYNEDLNNSNLGQDHIYAGRLDKIFQNKLVLRDFFHLEKNDWESFSKDKEIFYDKETYIYDIDRGKEVSPKEFFTAKYSVDEDNKEDTHSRDWYGYVYTDGDRASTIFVKKKMDSILNQRTTIGTVESLPADDIHMGWRIKLRDAKDWSKNQEEWKAKNSSLFIYLKDAMVVKDGKRVGISDIKVGDRLYLTRDSNMAKVIVIK